MAPLESPLATAQGVQPSRLTALTLIGLGEVKVDLADFDLKLQENLLCT
jgi:hypothetical protein